MLLNTKVYKEILDYQESHNLDFRELAEYAMDNNQRWFRFLCDEGNCREIVIAITERKIQKLKEQGGSEKEIQLLEQKLEEETEDQWDFLWLKGKQVM